MDATLKEILTRLTALEDRIHHIEKSLHIQTVSNPQLISRACTLLRSSVQVSESYLQKELKIPHHVAQQLYTELEELGIIKTIEINSDPIHPSKVGKISIYKIKKYLEKY